MRPSPGTPLRLPARIAHDTKIRGILIQVAIAAIVVVALVWFGENTRTNLATRGITTGFEFLERAARFPIAQSIFPYSPTDRFAWACIVGLVNTLYLALLIGAASTVLGLMVAIARRSANPLAAGLATTFVETLRNTPLVVQLLFWYALVTLGLPHSRAALEPLPGVFLTDRGLFFPAVRVFGDTALFNATVLAGLAAVMLAVIHGRRPRLQTVHGPRRVWAVILVAIALIAIVGWMTDLGLALQRPQLQRFNFRGGHVLTPEFVAIFVGLVLYSTAFAGEIVRGGIDAVSVGQWEAARAVGLSERQTLKLVILPQALRVIIPPMTSQYITIIRNTTLAVVVGYPDIVVVISTMINQTGQAVEGVLILTAVFVIISTASSLLMNWYNRRIALVQR
jgi:general L-amino acid transport system permease protein